MPAFENDPRFANAPAQEVFIEDPSAAHLDWFTFHLEEIGWGKTTLSSVPGSTALTVAVCPCAPNRISDSMSCSDHPLPFVHPRSKCRNRKIPVLQRSVSNCLNDHFGPGTLRPR